MERHGLVSQRLRLEPTSTHHAARVYEAMSDERLWTYFPNLRPKSLEELRELYRRWQRGNPYANRDEAWENWICLLQDTETPVGAFQATILPEGTAYIAYAIYIDYQRQGYAREGARAVIDHLRDVHHVRRVLADMHKENTASINLAETLGFKPVPGGTKMPSGHGPGPDDCAYELLVG